MITEKQKKRMRKLVDALLSGKYEQARKTLRLGNSFCCLGVACDIYRKETKKGKWVRSSGDDSYDIHSFLEHTSYLPDKVMKWFGFGDPRGDKIGKSELSLRNDLGQSFKQIANAIERHYDL